MATMNHSSLRGWELNGFKCYWIKKQIEQIHIYPLLFVKLHWHGNNRIEKDLSRKTIYQGPHITGINVEQSLIT